MDHNTSELSVGMAESQRSGHGFEVSAALNARGG